MAYYGGGRDRGGGGGGDRGGGDRGGGGGGGGGAGGEGGEGDHFFGHHGRERMVFDGKRMRKPIQRKTVDFNSTVIEYIKV